MRKTVKLLCFLLLPAIGLLAQAPESLLIGPGDMLHVQVFDTPELEQHARVTDAGEITLLLGGNVKVAALAPPEAAHAIEQRLLEGHFLLRPRVTVTVEEFTTQKVSVLGEVKSPGAYAINTPRSVLEVLALAGGLTELADRKIMIERRVTGEKVPYYVSNKPGLAMETAVQIRPGDTVLVPKAGIVYMLGDVRVPGAYVMGDNESQITALHLLARSGGTNNTAVPSHARLIRKSGNGYIEIPVALSAMQKGNQADMLLQPDDIVYVPFSYLRNAAVNISGIASSVGSAAVYRF
jgi:polysaccharide export outer membrane protein